MLGLEESCERRETEGSWFTPHQGSLSQLAVSRNTEAEGNSESIIERSVGLRQSAPLSAPPFVT